MTKILRAVAIMFVVLAFGMSTLALAEDFFVVKDAAGKVTVVDKKPADAKSIVKGPFKTKAEAENAIKAVDTKAKPAVPPADGC